MHLGCMMGSEDFCRRISLTVGFILNDITYTDNNRTARNQDDRVGNHERDLTTLWGWNKRYLRGDLEARQGNQHTITTVAVRYVLHLQGQTSGQGYKKHLDIVQDLPMQGVSGNPRVKSY
jgi:hypothetical protein